MTQSWNLKSINIELQAWGDYKGKHIGKICFENGDKEAFTFNLTPERTAKYLELISEEICGTAKQLGERLMESMKELLAPPVVLTLNEPSHEMQ